MTRPSGLDERPEDTRNEGVSAQQQRELHFARCRGESAQLTLGERVGAKEIRRETLLRGWLPAEVREQHSRVEEHPVAELAETREERLGAELAIEKAEHGARLTRRVSSRGLHAALLGEHPHPAGGLRLEV